MAAAAVPDLRSLLCDVAGLPCVGQQRFQNRRSAIADRHYPTKIRNILSDSPRIIAQSWATAQPFETVDAATCRGTDPAVGAYHGGTDVHRVRIARRATLIVTYEAATNVFSCGLRG